MSKKREPLSDVPWDNEFDEENDGTERKVNKIEEKINKIEGKVSNIENTVKNIEDETSQIKRKVSNIEERQQKDLRHNNKYQNCHEPRVTHEDEKGFNRRDIFRSKDLKRKIKQWSGNALVIAVVAAIIAVAGQLAATPADFTIFIKNNDFKLPTAYYDPSVVAYLINAEIYVMNIHPFLSPYKHGVFLRVLNMPKNVEIRISPKEIKADNGASMTIIYHLNSSSAEKFDEYPITIEGRGGDGKIRNSTIFLSTS